MVPRKRINEMLEETYNGTSEGYFGANKTLNKIREQFYWVNMREDVEHGNVDLSSKLRTSKNN